MKVSQGKKTIRPENEETRLRRFMEWVIVISIMAITLTIIPDVNDSVFLKPYLLYAGAAILLTLMLYWFLHKKELDVSLSGLQVAVVAFLSVSILSLIKADNIYLGLEGCSILVGLVILFFAGSMLFQDEQAERKLLRWLSVLCWIVCIVGFAQALDLLPSKITILAPGQNVISTLGNTTYFAGFLVALLPLMLSRLVLAEKQIQKIECCALLVLVLYTLIRTESRSGWFAAVLGIFLFILMNFQTKKVRIAALTLMVVGCAIIVALFHGIILRRLEGAFVMDPTSSVPRRLFIYQGAWRAFLSSPLLGNGIGNFLVFLPKFRAPGYWMFQSEDLVPHAHNEFLEIASESGLLGIAAFLAVLLIFIIIVRKNLRSLQGSQRTIFVGFTAAIISILADNLLSMNLRTIPVAAVFWIILGAASQYEKTALFHRTVRIPSLSKSVRLLVFLPLVLFLVWLVPNAVRSYEIHNDILRGNVGEWNHDDGTASAMYREALSSDSTDGVALYALAASLYRQQQYAQALQRSISLLRLYPYHPKASLIAALSAFELGDTASTMKFIKRELVIENSPQTYYYYAYFIDRVGNLPLERQILVDMLKQSLAGKIPDFVSDGIERLKMLNTTDIQRIEVNSILTDIIKTFPSDASILLASAKCYRALGEREQVDKVLSQLELLPVSDRQIQGEILKLKSDTTSSIPVEPIK